MVSQHKILDWSDRVVLDSVAAGVFDEAVEPLLLEEFLRDERHHLAVARGSGDVHVRPGADQVISRRGLTCG